MDTVFIPARPDVLRYGTPDPEGDWIMYGYVLESQGEITLIDPPVIPGLLADLERIGKVKTVILTTTGRTRGAKYIALKTGVELLPRP